MLRAQFLEAVQHIPPTTLFSVSTFFDAKSQKLPVPASALPPGGVRILYSFYAMLFTATKQSGKKTSTTSEEARVANSTLSYGELHFLLKGKKGAGCGMLQPQPPQVPPSS